MGLRKGMARNQCTGECQCSNERLHEQKWKHPYCCAEQDQINRPFRSAVLANELERLQTVGASQHPSASGREFKCTKGRSELILLFKTSHQAVVEREGSLSLFTEALDPVGLDQVRERRMDLGEGLGEFVLNIFVADISDLGRHQLNFPLSNDHLRLHLLTEFPALRHRFHLGRAHIYNSGDSAPAARR